MTDEFPKKSNKLLIFGIILIVLIVSGIIAFIFIGIDRGWFSKEKKQTEIKTSKLLITIVDYDNPELKISSDFIIQNRNNTFTKSGNYKAGIISEVDVPINNEYWIWACNDNPDYYSQLVVQPIGEKVEKTEILIECLKIEKEPVITHTGYLQNGDNSIVLNISVKNYLRNIFLCLSWDLGVVRAEFDKKTQSCDINWTNCSRYETNKKNELVCVEYYPESYWSCESNKMLIQCSEVDGKECSLLKMPIPSFLNNKVKFCNRFDDSLKGESIEYKINYRSWQLYPQDCLRVYIGDSDYDLNNNVYYKKDANGVLNFLMKFLFEKDLEDIKAKTFEYSICS